ncbi:MAG: efflux RND transporter periplasmic adaptor subunit [Bacteroidetes bacterium]|nr:MAG: efflux RND transporter periplasmic adaptor subunit [Bacteroidota bacterium]
MKNAYLLMFVVVVLFSSCKKEEVKQQLPPEKIKVFEVKAKTVPIYEEYVGQVYGEKDIPIRARVEGFLEKRTFEEGSRVKKGQLLYTIDSDPFLEDVVAQQSMVSQAETILIQMESDLNRIKPLAEMDAVSKRDLDMAQAQRDAAISSVKASKANLKIAQINLGYTKIYSPINGIIGKTLAREGEFVGKDPNPVILNTVSELKNIRVHFFLSENEYLIAARQFIGSFGRVETKKEKLNLELILTDGSVYKHKGVIDFIDRNIDASTGAILLQATFPNPDRLLRPGQFARVKVRVANVKDALMVPQKCLTELQGQYSVLVVNAENKVETVQVIIGEKVSGFTIIKEGLKSGDKVILEGLQKARPGMEVIPEVTEFKSQTNPQ